MVSGFHTNLIEFERCLAKFLISPLESNKHPNQHTHHHQKQIGQDGRFLEQKAFSNLDCVANSNRPVYPKYPLIPKGLWAIFVSKLYEPVLLLLKTEPPRILLLAMFFQSSTIWLAIVQFS